MIPRGEAPKALVVEVDGSMLPIRGAEAWNEAKVGLTYRHDVAANEPMPGTARYAAVVGGLGNFSPVLEELLQAERMDEAGVVIWVGDGATCNWTLADQLSPDAVQILDCHHAVEHAVECGRVLLGEESPWLPLWQRRAEGLLLAGTSPPSSPSCWTAWRSFRDGANESRPTPSRTWWATTEQRRPG